MKCSQSFLNTPEILLLKINFISRNNLAAKCFNEIKNNFKKYIYKLSLHPDVFQDKYADATRRILDTAAAIRAGISKIPGLRILGDPLLCIIAFTSDEFHIYQLADEMKVFKVAVSQDSLLFFKFYESTEPTWAPDKLAKMVLPKDILILLF